MVATIHLKTYQTLIARCNLDTLLKNKTCSFELTIVDDLYYQIIISNSEFGLNELQILKEQQVALGAKKLPVLVLCGKHSSTDVELLTELSKNENNPYSKADAFVISSLAQKLLANFYLKIISPERPTKFFRSQKEATEWLKSFF